MLKKILHEPLLHFLLVGSILFFYLSSNDNSVQKEQIVISKGKINQLTSQFEKTRQRKPNNEELQALIDNQIREDLAFKHGRQMGLVENDTIIKRRVQQKIEFMLNDSIEGIEPTKQELQTYLDTHKEKFTIAPVYSFKHIYINPEKHNDLPMVIAEIKKQNMDDSYKDLGDSIMLQSQYMNITTAQVARLFGMKFAKSLDTIRLHTWEGPVKSGYGLHLVKIDAKIPKHHATLDEIESTIRRDLRIDTQKKAINAFYDELRAKYNVRIEKEVK